MLGPTHRLFGAFCGVAYATWQGAPTGIVVASGLIATATAHGWSSPDMDLTDPIGRFVGHRKLTHRWFIPAAAWWAVGTVIPGPDQWPFYALIIGWVSHLVGDLFFGGIPIWLWGSKTIGWDLDTGGFLETGKAELWGRERRIIPFGPVRVTIVAGLAWLLCWYPAA